MSILETELSETGVLTLTMNRPERKNALDLAMADALVEALGAAETNPDVRCAVLTGQGDAFCSGGDLAGDGDPNAKRQHGLALMRRISRPAYTRRFRKEAYDQPIHKTTWEYEEVMVAKRGVSAADSTKLVKVRRNE